MPKVSVIIPAYNYAHYLPETVESVLGQTFQDFEIVIVDDGSSDNTREVASKIAARDPSRISYYRKQNSGVTDTRNLAVEKSKGEYILPLDADDLLEPEALAEFVAAIESDPKTGFVYSALRNFGKENNVWDPGDYHKDRFIWENQAVCTSLFRREFFLRGIQYRKVIFEDWDLWLQIVAAGYEGRYIPKTLFKYRIHHAGRNTINKHRYFQALIQEINLNPSLYNDQLCGWAKNAGLNFPGCLERPSIIFLPAPGSVQYTNFSGSWAETAKSYAERGYFVTVIGDYKNGCNVPNGVTLISFRSEDYRAELKRELYKLGRELLVFNGHPSEAEFISSLENVIQVIDARGELILPKISVVTVSYNQGEFIEENITSVLNQHYPNFEQLVIDGGSTDSTLEILKKYPHLNWSSEPDRGQTHALNKGFSRAQGEIVAWLNSDDYYPNGVFFEVAAKLRDYPLVIGACQVTGRQGENKEFVPNYGRSWFDVLKYWVYFSSPAQPSIFFKRFLLEEFKLSPGVYLDEELDFCMDYEFWLRIGSKYPLTNYSSKTLSYCRTYDTNKTGRDMDSVYREMSRVFSRYSKKIAGVERALSFIFPVSEFSPKLTEALNLVSDQSLQDFEILVADYSSDPASAKALRRAVLNFEKTKTRVNVRYHRSLSSNFAETVSEAINAAGGELVCLLPPGASISKDFCLDAVNLFRQDNIALALFIKNDPSMQGLIKRRHPDYTELNLDGVFSSSWIRPAFIARKAALLEVSGISGLKTDYFIVNSLILKLVNKGWQINVENPLVVTLPEAPEAAERNAKVSELSGVFAAKTITSIFEDEDEFTRLRAQYGFALSFNKDLIERSKVINQELGDRISL